MGRPKGRLCGHDPADQSKWDCRACKRERDARYRANRTDEPLTSYAGRNQHVGRQPMHCLVCDESFRTHPLRSCLPLARRRRSPMEGRLVGAGRAAA